MFTTQTDAFNVYIPKYMNINMYVTCLMKLCAGVIIFLKFINSPSINPLAYKSPFSEIEIKYTQLLDHSECIVFL